MQFDFVVGNPPFQGAKGQMKTLYPSIVLGALKKLKPGGQLSIIHPSEWRQGNHAGRHLMAEYRKHTIKAELGDYYRCIDLWGIKSDLDEILLTKNNTPNLEVKFLKENKFTKIEEWDIIPTRRYKEFLRVYAPNKKDRLEIGPPAVTYGELKPQKDEEFKYPVIKTIPNNFPDKGCWYTNIKPDIRPRICIGWGSLNNLLDLEGEYHMDPYNNKVLYDPNDSKENLQAIYDVITNMKFLEFMAELSGVDQVRLEDYRYRNRMFFWKFKKDFWKYLDL